MSDPLQASLLRLSARGISIFSPHTSLDATPNGINTWYATQLPLYTELRGDVGKAREAVRSPRILVETHHPFYADRGVRRCGNREDCAVEGGNEDIEDRGDGQRALGFGTWYVCGIHLVAMAEGRSVQLATPRDEPDLNSIAVCAGSGEASTCHLSLDDFLTV